jgi:hypothetical protein
MKKRKHHYVWEHYLRAWAVNGTKIWCRRKGRQFFTSTENVAQSRDFYRLQEISEPALLFIEGLIEKHSSAFVREASRGWIPHFRVLFDTQRKYIASGMSSSELAKELDRGINDLEEEIHTNIEATAIPLLSALREGDASFLKDDTSAVDFAAFIASQYLRTPNMMKSVMRSVGPAAEIIEPAWGLLRTVLATTLSAGLFTKVSMTHVNLLESGATTEFITGDQPVLNTRATPGATSPPEQLEFYYPLSPKRALLWTFNDSRFAIYRRQLSVDETLAFNRLIVARSDEQLYASTERGLLQSAI